MAGENQDAGGRWFLRASLVALSATAGASFGRLYQGGSTAWRLAAAGAIAAALASVLERRALALSLLGGVAGLVVTLGILVFPANTLAGLPTPETLRVMLRALGNVSRHAATEFTPAAPLPSLVSASMIGVWCAALASHALAARAGSAFLAILPPAGLLAFAGMLGPGGPRPLQVAVAVAASIGVLFGANLRRLRAWGPVLSRGGTPAAAAPARDASRLAFAALVAALLLPGILPGLGAQALLRLDLGLGTRVSIDPIVDIRPSLRRNPPTELFTVQARRPSYWRLLTLDAFDGLRWTAPALRPAADDRAPVPPDPLPAAFGGEEELLQEFRISGLEAINLPVAPEPRGVAVPLAGAGYNPEHQTVMVPSLPAGLTYQAASSLALPTVQEADALTHEDFVRAATTLPGYAGLPRGVPYRVAEVAREVIRGEKTPYRQIVAIQDHLKDFTYDLSVPPGHQGNAIVHFLERSRRGYCEQFAAAMAIMVRSLGYPARVAVGFTQGTPDRDGVYHVTTREAHAWPEVYFPGSGWVAFEPTPTRANPVTSELTEPPAVALGGSVAATVGARTEARESAEAQRQAAERAAEAAEPRQVPSRGGGIPRVVLVSGAILLALAAWAGLRRLRRRLAIRRARTPRSAVLAAYRAFEEIAADVKIPRDEHETPREYAARLRGEVRFSDGHLERLTGLLELAAFSGRGLGADDARRAGEAGRALHRDVRRHAGWLRSLAGSIRPGW